jgi:hypothetical protein
METKQFDPSQPDRERQYDNPPGRDYNESDPKRDPAMEEDTRQQAEIHPVADGQENKSPLRPIDANKSPEDFRQAPLGHQQSATHGTIHNSPTDNPVNE